MGSGSVDSNTHRTCAHVENVCHLRVAQPLKQQGEQLSLTAGKLVNCRHQRSRALLKSNILLGTGPRIGDPIQLLTDIERATPGKPRHGSVVHNTKEVGLCGAVSTTARWGLPDG
jgi:hypothetical protein